MKLTGTLYDDNAIPVASAATGDGSSSYTSLNVNNQTYNGTAYERQQSRQGVAVTTSGGVATVPVVANGTADTVVKPAAGRLCRVLLTVAPTVTTGTTAIYDNATGHTGTVLAVIPNNTAVGTVVDVQMPTVNGITVAGSANCPGMTISYV